MSLMFVYVRRVPGIGRRVSRRPFGPVRLLFPDGGPVSCSTFLRSLIVHPFANFTREVSRLRMRRR